MTDLGIAAFGAYVPRLRIDRAIIAEAHRWAMPSLRSQAKGARAFTSWDEDAITMAVEAARDALGSGSAAPFKALRLASKERDRQRGYNRYLRKATPVAAA